MLKKAHPLETEKQFIEKSKEPARKKELAIGRKYLNSVQFNPLAPTIAEAQEEEAVGYYVKDGHNIYTEKEFRTLKKCDMTALGYKTNGQIRTQEGKLENVLIVGDNKPRKLIAISTVMNKKAKSLLGPLLLRDGQTDEAYEIARASQIKKQSFRTSQKHRMVSESVLNLKVRKHLAALAANETQEAPGDDLPAQHAAKGGGRGRTAALKREDRQHRPIVSASPVSVAGSSRPVERPPRESQPIAGVQAPRRTSAGNLALAAASHSLPMTAPSAAGALRKADCDVEGQRGMKRLLGAVSVSESGAKKPGEYFDFVAVQRGFVDKNSLQGVSWEIPHTR